MATLPKKIRYEEVDSRTADRLFYLQEIRTIAVRNCPAHPTAESGYPPGICDPIL